MSTPGDQPWSAASGDETTAWPGTDESRPSWPPGELVDEPVPDRAPDAEDAVEETPPVKRAPRKAAKKVPPKKAAPRKAPAKKAPPRTLPPAEPPLHEGAPPTDVPFTTLPADPAPVAVAEPPRSRRGRAVALVVLVLLLAGAAGFGVAAYNESRPDTFVSRAVLLIDQQPALTYAKDDGLVLKLGQLRIKYRDMVTSTTFARDVAQRTGYSAGLVHSTLSAQAAPQSLLLTVTSTSPDRTVPESVAQAAAELLSNEAEATQRREKVPPAVRITLTVVSPAQPAAQLSASRRRSEQLGLGAALGVLLAAALIRDLTRRQQVVRVSG